MDPANWVNGIVTAICSECLSPHGLDDMKDLARVVDTNHLWICKDRDACKVYKEQSTSQAEAIASTFFCALPAPDQALRFAQFRSLPRVIGYPSEETSAGTDCFQMAATNDSSIVIFDSSKHGVSGNCGPEALALAGFIAAAYRGEDSVPAAEYA